MKFSSEEEYYAPDFAWDFSEVFTGTEILTHLTDKVRFLLIMFLCFFLCFLMESWKIVLVLLSASSMLKKGDLKNMRVK